MTRRHNPPWSNTILRRTWAALAARVGPKRMPALRTDTGKRVVAIEYGTGSFGVVVPTQTPGLVLKLTTDASEARFAAIMLAQKSAWPPGLVRYHDAVLVRNAFQQPERRGKRDVFALWRDEATHVGKVTREDDNPRIRDDYDRGNARQFARRLGVFREAGAMIFRGLKSAKDRAKVTRDMIARSESYRGDYDVEEYMPRSYDRPTLFQHPNFVRLRDGVYRTQRLALAFDIARSMAEMMANEPFGTEVGDALLDLLTGGVFVTDVHLGNLGLVTPEGYDTPIPAVIDPGLTLFLTDHYDAIRVPAL